MSELALLRASARGGTEGAPFALEIELEVRADCVFELDAIVEPLEAGGRALARRTLRQTGLDLSWLPRGRYRLTGLATRTPFPPETRALRLRAAHAVAGAEVIADERIVERAAAGQSDASLAWQIEAHPGTTPIEALSWRRGGGDWFFKHFDHAARTVASYLLGDSPLLRGSILDVGCGDGVTDLGLALRRRPREIIGIDPFRGYERLLELARAAHLPLERLPENLSFLPADANALPFDDDRFDVVVSWGSLEHIVGGYERPLAEIRRVLKPGGLLFAHPGLFYSDVGHHLGEFAFARAEPYVHLKHPRERLREMVLATEPDRIDRAGDVATRAQYWQWFTELNPITVDGFERSLRDAGFEPWRVALRTHERVDYTPELQPYSFVDLAVGELYVSAYNRKSR